MSSTPNDLLRQEREKRGWSQARVAEQVGTDPGNVSRWERGRAVPSPYFRERLCTLFGQTAGELGFIPEGAVDPLSLANPPERREHTEAAGTVPTASMPETVARWLAVLSYLGGWISGLFLYLLARDRFVRFHALQSLCFFGAAQVISVAVIVLLVLLKHGSGSPPNALVAVFNAVLLTFLVLESLFLIVAWMVGMLQAWRGRYYRLPFMSRVVVDREH